MNGKLQHWVIKIVDQSDRLIVFDPKPSSGRLPETRSNWKKSKNFLVRKLIQKSVLTNMGSSNTKLITARQVISAQKTDYKVGIYGSHLIGPPLLFFYFRGSGLRADGLRPDVFWWVNPCYKALKRAANGDIPLGYGWSKVELDQLVSIFRKAASKRKLSWALSAMTILQMLVNKRTKVTLGIIELIPAAVIEIANITMR